MTRLTLWSWLVFVAPLAAPAQDFAVYFDNFRLIEERVLPLIRQLDSNTFEERRKAADILLQLDKTLDRLTDESFALLSKYADANDDAALRGGLQQLVKDIRARTHGEEVRRLRGHRSTIAGMTFSPDSARLATASWDRTVRVWDVKSGKQLFLLRHDDMVQSVTFSPDGRSMASIGKEVRLWEANTCKERYCFRDPHWSSGATYDLCFSADSARLLACPNDGVLRSWNVATGKLAGKWKVGQGYPLRVSADGTRVYVGASDWVSCWGLTSGERVWTETAQQASNGTSLYRSLTLSRDGSEVLTGNRDGMVRIFEAKTGKVIRTLDSKRFPAEFLSLSAKGDRLLLGRGREPLQLLTYPGCREMQRWKLPRSGESVEGVALSPDGRWAAANGDECVRLFQVKER